MCRGGRPASSPAGGNQSGRDKGMEELCLEHAEQGGQQTAGRRAWSLSERPGLEVEI